MKKIEKELSVQLDIVLTSVSVFFIASLSSDELCRYFSIDKSSFNLFFFLFAVLFFTFLFYRVRKSIKQIQTVFHKALALKKRELKKANAELKETNKRLKHRLYKDTLTSLPNRQALERDMESMQNPKIIILDIDSFKDINECYGSCVGDAILLEVSKELRDFSKKENLQLYRVGADEFVLLEDKNLDMDRYEGLANTLIELFKTKSICLVETSDTVKINVTLGICFDLDNTLEKAILALEEAKKKQRNFLCYFKKIDRKNAYIEQVKWAKFINSALKDNRVIPYYQPIFDADKKVLKHECLVRILDEKGEIVPPNLFLEISKKVKRYSAIEKLLIEKTFQAIQNTKHIISVNILARDMSDSDVSNFVVMMLKKYQVSKQLVFEILENENIEHLERISTFIQKIRRMGCKIAIDDFGTGYSNFSYLTKLKPDYIKIDGSLIRDLEKDENSYAIVASIVTFAQKLKIRTIAEYIHNKEVFEICKTLGIDEFQGFYLGEPSPKLLEE